ncbi:MAG: SDR family oxidoreductase [Acidimicrobiales bacterium]
MRILVTGAGSGVGKATAALLAGRGHEVVATARDRAALDDLDVAARLHLDVTDAASVDEIRLELGWVDALVNNAAISFGGPIEHVAMEQVRQMFETNVFGPVRLIQAFVPGMRDRRSGVVVNISSVAGHVAQPLSGYYAATKHALEAISEALYVELAHFGVRVVVVEPGFITPGMKTHEAAGAQGTAGALEAYEALDAQLAQLANKMLGGALTGPEVVAKVIADAIDNGAGGLRRRVGDDANLILSARNTLGDEEFETAMREFVGLTW